MKAVINAEWLATEISSLIYRNGKAKMFNVLESQIENTKNGALTAFDDDSPKLRAVKRITEDLLETISKQAAQLIRDTLGDWKEKVECDDDGDTIGKDDSDFYMAPGTIQRLEPEYAEADLIRYPSDKAAKIISNNRVPIDDDKVAANLCGRINRAFKSVIEK